MVRSLVFHCSSEPDNLLVEADIRKLCNFLLADLWFRYENSKVTNRNRQFKSGASYASFHISHANGYVTG